MKYKIMLIIELFEIVGVKIGGESGGIRMNRNKNNQCGFASDGSFAIPIGWMDKN
jgi:hypothetical protein